MKIRIVPKIKKWFFNWFISIFLVKCLHNNKKDVFYNFLINWFDFVIEKLV